jgi:phage-related baseplate assembly protein
MKPPRKIGPPPRDPTVRAIRHWWEHQLAQVADQKITLGSAMADLGLYACGHLIKRLVDPKTPEDVRDTIALRCAPLLAVQVRAKVGEARRQDDAPTADATQRLLDAYNVTTEPPN